MIYIVTGNENKRKEIEQFILGDDIEFFDIDLREIKANSPSLIVAYKLLEALKHLSHISDDDLVVVEDLTMEVNGKFIPDIKWKQDELKDGDKVKIILTIGVADKNFGRIFRKELLGFVKKVKCDKYDFGFDNIVFIGNQCLGDYKKKHPLRDIYKDIFDKSKIRLVYNLNNLPEWTGEYQNEKDKR